MYQDIVIEINDNSLIKTKVYSIRKSLMCISSMYIFLYFLFIFCSFFIENKIKRNSQIISSIILFILNFIGFNGYKLYDFCLIKIYNIYLILELIIKIISFFYLNNLFLVIIFLILIVFNLWIIKLSYKFLKYLKFLNNEEINSLKNHWTPNIYNVIYI